jgi:hypothetical protein
VITVVVVKVVRRTIFYGMVHAGEDESLRNPHEDEDDDDDGDDDTTKDIHIEESSSTRAAIAEIEDLMDKKKSSRDSHIHDQKTPEATTALRPSMKIGSPQSQEKENGSEIAQDEDAEGTFMNSPHVRAV